MVRIATLMDNSEGVAGTTAEHGLSFHIERDGRSMIFDTGKSGAFLTNARALGIDPFASEAVAISHGHYDHGGGVRSLYADPSFRVPLWTGGGFFDKKWSDEKPAPRYLGVDFDEAWLRERGIERLEITAPSGEIAFREILPGIFAVNGFPRIHPQEMPAPRFVVDREGRRRVDDFRDEICLAVESDSGLVAVLGCAHPGMMNMLDAVRSAIGRPLAAVFGGSHLVEADAERIEASISYLENSGCRIAAFGHCTGAAGSAALASRLKSWRPLSVGTEFCL